MKKLLACLAIVAFFTGCASYKPMGSLYTQGKQGLQDNGGPVSKEGKACMTSILSLIATGDASIQAAKDNGGISKVSTIDYTVENVLGIYGTYCTVVRGQ